MPGGAERPAHPTGELPGSRRNCVGVIANCALKWRQKEALSAKPQELAISEMRSVVEERSCFAMVSR